MLSGLRRRIGALIGGFEAAQGSRRLKGFQPSRAHVNTLVAASGPEIIARARYLVRNNGYALNATESWTGNSVGTGIKPSSLIADAALKATVQKLWLAWTDESDAEGLTDFYGQQRRVAREVFIAGEVFFRLRPRRPEDGLSVPLQLQMLPSEMLPLTRTETLANGNVIRFGIEFDRIGRRVAYHFLRRHPGDLTDPGLAGETVAGSGLRDHPRHRPGGLRPASRRVATGPGHRQAGAARPVRRRGIGAQKDRGHVRDVRHFARARRRHRRGSG